MNKILLALTLPMLLTGCARLKSFGYRGFNRDKWQYPQRVIAALLLNSGDQVADIGSGGGYFPLLDHDFLPRQHFLLFGIQE